MTFFTDNDVREDNVFNKINVIGLRFDLRRLGRPNSNNLTRTSAGTMESCHIFQKTEDQSNIGNYRQGNIISLHCL